MGWDRVLDAFYRAARGMIPRLDTYRPFYGKVIHQNPDGTVDVVSDDPMMPPGGLSHLPLRHGIPGLTKVSIATGTSILIFYENGDPSRACVGLWAGSETGVRLVLTADMIVLGGTDGAEPPAKGQTLQDYLNATAKLLAAHLHPASSGTTSPSLTLAAPALTPPDILATNVVVK